MFILYIDRCEGITVYRSRVGHAYELITEYSLEQIADKDAPAGCRNIYSWELTTPDKIENCLCILSLHQSIEVYLDNELIYSMEPSARNKIGGTPGTIWNTIPVYPSDAGKEITVIVTPLFKNVIDYGIEIWCGSHFAILFDHLSQELPQLFTSLLCIILGILIILIELYFTVGAETQPWDMFFLGSFAIFLGLWRFTYPDAIAILYPEHTMTLGYITIGALFLCNMPLALFAGSFLKHNRPLLITSLLSSTGTLCVLLLQILNVLELKEILTVCHIMLISTICTTFGTMWKQRKRKPQGKKSFHPTIFIGIGCLVDLIAFKLNETASNLIFTVSAFIICALTMFVTNIAETSRQAYADERTGLANRFRWNELMNEEISSKTTCAILMFDLNGVKHINDTYGHDNGDKLIFNFSNILRNTLPGTSVICRWGGDKFTVMLLDVTRAQLENHILSISQATEEYNAFSPEHPISYAVGAAFSEDHPGASRPQLFLIADEQMYRNKRAWYAEKTTE